MSQAILPRLSLDEGWTCAPVDRRGPSAYVHLIRAPGDPERRARAKSLGGPGNNDKASEGHWSKLPPAEECAEAITALLADDVPRTFNRIAVELWDKTADVAFGQGPDHGLWLLVERGDVEHTLTAPVLFRRRRCS